MADPIGSRRRSTRTTVAARPGSAAGRPSLSARVAARPWPLVAVATAAGAVAALAVPVGQIVRMVVSDRPEVPGPYDQDGVVLVDGDDGPPVDIVWLGDSLASGVGAEHLEAAFPRRAATLLGALHRRPVALTCLARPGACAADVLADQVPLAGPRLGPGSVAVVTVGSNDVGGLTRPGEFRRTYAGILAALVATGATVVAVGLPDLGSAVVIPQPLRTLARGVGHRATRHIQRLADDHGAHFVGIDVRASRGTKALTYLAADRWHPNGDTYHLWADRVAALLHPLTHGPLTHGALA